MRRIFEAIALFCLVFTIRAQAQSVAQQPGAAPASPAAPTAAQRPATAAPFPPPQTISDEDLVRSMAPGYVAKALTVVESVSVSGDHAKALVKIADQACTLNLVKQRAAAASGWMVEKMDCRK